MPRKAFTICYLPIILLSAFVCCQDLSIPFNWRKPKSNLSSSERLDIAQSAIELLIPAIQLSGDGTGQGMSTWSSGNIPAALAQHDYIARSQNYHALVTSTIQLFRDTYPPIFDQTLTLKNVVSEPIMWGLAAFYGARAYNDSGLLSLAVDVWNVAQPYYVSVQDGARGTQASRNESFPTNCIPTTTSAGAVFWVSYQPWEMESNVITVGAYVALSAHLWESTKDTTYLDSAEQSAHFIYDHLYSETDKVLWDSYNLSDCNNNGFQWIHNQGFFLEGISILSSASVHNNTTSWATILQTLVISTVKNPIWVIGNGSNAGILLGDSASNPEQFQDQFIWKNVFIRALYEIWARSALSSPLASLIEAFIMVQYNALLDLASANETFYSPIWTGPPVDESSAWGQLSAVDVLNAAIGMSPAESSMTATPMSQAKPTSRPVAPHANAHASSLSDGDIAGICIGVSIVVALIILGAFRTRRRQRRNRGKDSEDLHKPDPFAASTPSTEHAYSEFEATSGRPIGYLVKDRRHNLADSHGEGTSFVPPSNDHRPVTTIATSSTPHEAYARTTPVTDSVVTTSGPPVDVPDTVLARLLQQVVERLHVQETETAPPTYTRQ
ncbi:unnamed protein product [Peniophora sp. CBMAI 1063]|nr:unnamed protein product [Peniophora sp. CBMAI 1063]